MTPSRPPLGTPAHPYCPQNVQLIVRRNGWATAWVFVSRVFPAYEPSWGNRLGVYLCAWNDPTANRTLRVTDVVARHVPALVAPFAPHHPVRRGSFVCLLQSDDLPERAAGHYDAPLTLLVVLVLGAGQHRQLGFLA